MAKDDNHAHCKGLSRQELHANDRLLRDYMELRRIIGRPLLIEETRDPGNLVGHIVRTNGWRCCQVGFAISIFSPFSLFSLSTTTAKRTCANSDQCFSLNHYFARRYCCAYRSLRFGTSLFYLCAHDQCQKCPTELVWKAGMEVGGGCYGVGPYLP